jgi:hypothetical protein
MKHVFMFDFLSDPKKQAIANHHVIGDIKKSPSNWEKFLEDLEAFRVDLCNKQDIDGSIKNPQLVFTDEDIKQIESYVKDIHSGAYVKICRLGDRILKEAGFEMCAHAAGREDCNDWNASRIYALITPRMQFTNTFYSRTAFNINESLFESEHLVSTCILEGLRFFTGQVSKNLEIAPKLPKNAKTGQIINPHGILGPVSSPNSLNLDTNPYYQLAKQRDQPVVLPFYLSCSIFNKDVKYRTEKINVGTRREVQQVPHRFFGRLGVKIRQSIEVPHIREQYVIESWTPIPLNQIIKSKETEPAYFLHFFLPKTIKDWGERLTNYVTVSMVLSKNLAEEIIAFLLEHPSWYMDLVRQFIPRKMFPNVTKRILNATTTTASRGLVFDNYTCQKRITLDH